MSISAQCPGCERKLKAKDKLAGERVKCPGCGQFLVLPRARSSNPTTPSLEKSASSAAVNRTVVPFPERRPLRWPWYVGGAAALSIVVVIVLMIALPGAKRTPAKDEVAALTQEPKSQPSTQELCLL
jgi:hypothetical protein